MPAPKTRPRTPLDDRLDEVLVLRGFDDGEWSDLAGFSEGYLKQMRHRATHEPDFRLPESGAEALSRVAGVRAEWLRFGRGPRDGVAASAMVVVREPKPTEIALVEAYALGAARYTARDFLAALELVRNGEQSWGDSAEERVRAGDALLAAVARVRREAKPVTWENVAHASLSLREREASKARDDELNAEGRRELAELGASPRRVPVRTPERGTVARPKPFKFQVPETGEKK